MVAVFTIRGEWESYLAAVVGEVATDDQREQLRMAFFGGATALFFGIINSMDKSTSEPTEADDEMMKAISVELRDFAYEQGLTLEMVRAAMMEPS